MELPVTMGAVAFVAAPFLTVAAAVAALAAEWTIDIERQLQDAADVEDSVDVTVVQNDQTKAPAA
ncbi:DUF4342 domain-containing protein [Nonomuraea sp. MTCD27]|uniref:DUF4342 domain-containing protein n=1 Tax=Nonomuraea sp. MTCD27 TaxID=1676747 RepID=UPI0035C00E98